MVEGAESAGSSVMLASDLLLCPYAHTQPQRFQLYRPFSIPWHLSLHLLDRVFPKVGTMILWYYQIKPKVVWKVVYGLMNTITKSKTKNNITKIMSVLFFPCSVS